MRSQTRSTSDKHVRGHEHGAAPPPRIGQQVIQRVLHQRIEPFGRLVENQQRRIRLKRLDDAELSFHPGAVFAHLAPKIAGRQLHPIEEFASTCAIDDPIVQPGEDIKGGLTRHVAVEPQFAREITDA